MNRALMYVTDGGKAPQKRLNVLRPDREDCETVYRYVFDVVGKKLGKLEHTVSRWKHGVENPSERIKTGIRAAVKAGVPMERLLVLSADLEAFIRNQFDATVDARDVMNASMIEQQTEAEEDAAQLAFNANPSAENAARLARAMTINSGADLCVASRAARFAMSAK